jgi:hypothetical protein
VFDGSSAYTRLPVDASRLSAAAPRASLLHGLLALSPRRWAVIASLVILALSLGARGIGDEGYVSMHGDAPRFLMNGAFLADLMHDRPFGSVESFLEYSRLYYARYPALSLGHHPPLLPALEAVAFGIFGVSVAAARVVPLVSLIASVILLYLLVEAYYGVAAGVLAAAVMATSPAVVVLSQSVLTELPTLALLLGAAYALHRFCITQSRGALAVFVATAALSIYAKQLAVFAFPAFAVMALSSLGTRRLLRRDVMVALGVFVVAVAPMVPLTLVMSQTNVAVALDGMSNGRTTVRGVVRGALEDQFVPMMVIVAAAALIRALVRFRGRASLFFVSWIVGVFGGLLLAGRYEPARYSLYWVPAIAAIVGTLAARWRHRQAAVAAIALVAVTIVVQGRQAVAVPLPSAAGYEAAAEYVIDHDPGATVLFSGPVDTGYFTFFTRKHDPARRLIVLRADKVLTTSLMGHLSVEDRIQRPAEIYDALRRFGTRYVVIEDMPSDSRVINWLREELTSRRFRERLRLPIVSTAARLRGVDLVIYEFVDAGPPATDAVLAMNIPLVGQSVTVKISDLMSRKHLR